MDKFRDFHVGCCALESVVMILNKCLCTIFDHRFLTFQKLHIAILENYHELLYFIKYDTFWD